MGYAVLNSEVTIGSLVFRGVHEVRIKRGLHGYRETAEIVLPHLAKIVKGRRSSPVVLATDQLFKDGEPVTIKLGYDGNLKTEFEGFVARRVYGMPMTVQCEGYSYKLQRVRGLNKTYASTTAKKVLEDACQGTGITVVCPVEFPIVNLKLLNANATDVIDHIMRLSQRTLNIFFIAPKTLWCGLVYTPYLAGSKVLNLPSVKYRPGYNLPRDNDLKQRLLTDPVQVFLNGMSVTGDAVRTESKDTTAQRRVKYVLNNIPDATTVKAFAQELQLKMNYTGFEGALNGFLVPFVEPGYTVKLTDKLFPERDGEYLVESVDTRFGVGGARRRVTVGPRVG